MALSPAVASACPVCFGSVESPQLDAARLGVGALAAVTVCVLGVFGAFFIRLGRLEASTKLLSSTISNPSISDQSQISNPNSANPQSAISKPRS